MAGDWLKWSKGLARKPEVVQIAHRLNVTRHHAAALLMEVWEWADENVMFDESASGFDPDNCPGSVRLGEPPTLLFDATFGVSGLADAMTAVGWITVRSGSLVFPNFGRHNGKSAKARALDSSRKRAERQIGNEDANSVPDVSGSHPDKSGTREEKRRIKTSSGKPKKARPPDPLFDAIAQVTRSDPNTAASHIGKVKKAMLEGEPPYSPSEVLEFGKRFRELCHWAKERDHPELGELQKYIGKIRAARQESEPSKPNSIITDPPNAPPLNYGRNGRV